MSISLAKKQENVTTEKTLRHNNILTESLLTDFRDRKETELQVVVMLICLTCSY